MPSLCIIADTHMQHWQVAVPPCDILIHCGDIGSFGADDGATFADADAWLGEQPAGRVIVVGGNHDFGLASGAVRLARAEVLEDRLVEAAGLSIYGAPWCPDLPGFAYHLDRAALRERWRRIPAGIDVLVTHTPPRGTLDLPTGGARHLGCEELAAELERIRPRLHVFGHVHASHGTVRTPQTLSVNAAVVGGPLFEVRHPATCLDLPRRGMLSRWLGRR